MQEIILLTATLSFVLGEELETHQSHTVVFSQIEHSGLKNPSHCMGWVTNDGCAQFEWCQSWEWWKWWWGWDGEDGSIDDEDGDPNNDSSEDRDNDGENEDRKGVHWDNSDNENEDEDFENGGIDERDDNHTEDYDVTEDVEGECLPAT